MFCLVIKVIVAILSILQHSYNVSAYLGNIPVLCAKKNLKNLLRSLALSANLNIVGRQRPTEKRLRKNGYTLENTSQSGLHRRVCTAARRRPYGDDSRSSPATSNRIGRPQARVHRSGTGSTTQTADPQLNQFQVDSKAVRSLHRGLGR